MTASTKKQPDATAQLAELEDAVKVARAAEREARDEQEAHQRAVGEAKAALTRAVAAGEGADDAERALVKAQAAAGGEALSARIAGLQQRTRCAEGAVYAHTEASIGALIEGLRPRAEAAVADIEHAAEELERALLEWSHAASEVSRVGGRLPWFAKRFSRSVPSGDVFHGLRRELGRLRGNVPLPLPTERIETPAQEQERAQREHQEEIERRRAMRSERSSGVRWDPDHPLSPDAA